MRRTVNPQCVVVGNWWHGGVAGDYHLYEGPTDLEGVARSAYNAASQANHYPVLLAELRDDNAVEVLAWNGPFSRDSWEKACESIPRLLAQQGHEEEE